MDEFEDRIQKLGQKYNEETQAIEEDIRKLDQSMVAIKSHLINLLRFLPPYNWSATMDDFGTVELSLPEQNPLPYLRFKPIDGGRIMAQVVYPKKEELTRYRTNNPKDKVLSVTKSTELVREDQNRHLHVNKELITNVIGKFVHLSIHWQSNAVMVQDNLELDSDLVKELVEKLIGKE